LYPLQTFLISNLSLNDIATYLCDSEGRISMATGSPKDIAMTDGQTPPPIPSEEPKYGGFTRFEVELEVIPLYLRLPFHKPS
jgi:hypothetical protein